MLRVPSGASIDLMSALKKRQILLKKNGKKNKEKILQRLLAKRRSRNVRWKKERERKRKICNIQNFRDNFKKMKNCGAVSNTRDGCEIFYDIRLYNIANDIKTQKSTKKQYMIILSRSETQISYAFFLSRTMLLHSKFHIPRDITLFGKMRG